jgi:hypothetical protein
MGGTPQYQAQVAYRWMHAPDGTWVTFALYWMAFNALYNTVHQEGDPESDAVENVITTFFDSGRAKACWEQIDSRHIDELIKIPPGDARFDSCDPRHRKKTTELAQLLKATPSPVVRIATLMRIIYQVRCNLLHGSKDPAVLRDQELVSACTPMLKIVVAHLQDIMKGHNRVP